MRNRKQSVLLVSLYALVLLGWALADAEAMSYTPVPGPEAYTPVHVLDHDPYACAQLAVEGIRSWHWRDDYADIPWIVGDAIEQFHELTGYFDDGRMTRCDVAKHIVAMSWWETSLSHQVWGMDREIGLVQVVPCDTRRHDRYECQNSYYAQSNSRPHSSWLDADPRRPVVWSLIRLTDREDGGFTFEGIRSHNGGGPLAYRYARRHFASVARIEDWQRNPRFIDSMDRDVRRPDSIWRQRVPGEPSYWTP